MLPNRRGCVTPPQLDISWHWASVRGAGQGACCRLFANPTRQERDRPVFPGAERGKRVVRHIPAGLGPLPTWWAGAAGDRGALALGADRLLRPPRPWPRGGGCVCSGMAGAAGLLRASVHAGCSRPRACHPSLEDARLAEA